MKICFVTEIDVSRKVGGAITNDLKSINCVRKFANVDFIYLQRQKHRSVWLALAVFVLQIFRSSSKSYQTYFSRGLFATFILIALKPFHRKKVVHNALSVPLPSVEVRYSKRTKVRSIAWYALMRFLERVVTRNADAIVVAADTYADELVTNGIRKDKVRVVPFYVEAEFFKQHLRSNSNGIFKFGYVGGFHPYHLLLPMIEAFEYLSKENSHIQLYLVGDGPLRPEIEKEVSKRGLDHAVRFLGSLPHSSIANFLSQVDSFVVLMEKPGMSTSLLEAAAAGKAIITMKRQSDFTLERYFKPEKEILYVKNASPQELAEAMRFVSEKPDVRETLSLGARRIAKRYFSEEACLSQLRKLMEEISRDCPRSIASHEHNYG